jgi:UPF0176 protein
MLPMAHYYQVLAYYYFTAVKAPHEEVLAHKQFFDQRDILSRIYISEQGINGQMSASKEDAEAYIAWMQSREEFKGISFKVHDYHEHVFPRQTVKYRKNLVAYDQPIDFSRRGEHVSPKKWAQMLKEKDKYLLLDVRNDYEWKVGRFEGADLPSCQTFREFEEYAERLKKEKDPEKIPVMMYCTGGIRCELYSSILKEKGFAEVYQLEGGIINYGLEEGAAHWLGKLFVFDDRLSIPICETETAVVGVCHHCDQPSESYYNCANMDCNELFLCCRECLQDFAGCCKIECQIAERVRPYQHQHPHKPFRKKFHYQEIKRDLRDN